MKRTRELRPLAVRRRLERQIRLANNEEVPLDQTLEVAGPVALATLEALHVTRYWRNRTIPRLAEGKGRVATIIQGTAIGSKGFIMENLPTMTPLDTPLATEPFGPGLTLCLDSRSLIRPRVGERTTLKRWRKTKVCDILFVSEEMNAYSLKMSTDNRVTLTIQNLQHAMKLPGLVTIARAVTYEDVLRGVRNAHAHFIPTRTSIKKATPSEIVGFLVQHGPWPVRIWISNLAWSLGVAIGNGMDMPQLKFNSGRLTPCGGDVENEIPAGLYLVGGCLENIAVTVALPDGRAFAGHLPTSKLRTGRYCININQPDANPGRLS